jgi:hypothetical protein
MKIGYDKPRGTGCFNIRSPFEYKNFRFRYSTNGYLGLALTFYKVRRTVKLQLYKLSVYFEFNR